MGMFFYVRPDKDDECPYCGAEIKEWQSKSCDAHDEWGGCCERHPEPLPLVEKSEVRNFYTDCPECKKWIEYNVIPFHYELVEKDF